MVALVYFDFHYSFLIISALFASFVLAIFYLSLASLLWLCWCTESASLLTATRCANGGGGVRIGHAGWRKKIFDLQI
jgi:hypothetical protein